MILFGEEDLDFIFIIGFVGVRRGKFCVRNLLFSNVSVLIGM